MKPDGERDQGVTTATKNAPTASCYRPMAAARVVTLVSLWSRAFAALRG
jgi:hypothetical protein